MFTRSTVFVSLLAWAVFLYFGSRNAQIHSSPAEAPPPPKPRIVPSRSTVLLDAAAILEAAHERIAGAAWLETRVRQRRLTGGSLWSSEGVLRRGPDGLCRLESEARFGGGRPRNVSIISDGRVLAKVAPAAGGKAKIESWPMPRDAAGRNSLLETHGCGGPSAVLGRLRERAANWTAQAASVDDRPGVALAAAVPPTSIDGLSVTTVRVFFDAESLWLSRAEWWTGPPDEGGSLVYDIEFLDPRIDQPLSADECQVHFSYRDDR